jgi:hypothetical protein
MKNPRHKLKELINVSSTLGMLPRDSKAILERELLSLPEKDIKELVAVFEDEKSEMGKLDGELVSDAGEFKKLTTNVVMAGQGLKKALIKSRENEDRQKEQHVEDDLLNDLDAA